MTTIAAPPSPVSTVTIGIDTHSEIHVAAALSGLGRLLGSYAFATTPAGTEALLHWSRGHGAIGAFGIEGTGSYGAELTRELQEPGVRGDRGRPSRPQGSPADR